MSPLRAFLPVLFAAACLASPAAADEPSPESKQAQKLFDEALVLLQANKPADACPKLEQSEALDPGMGTRYRLAECYEAMGKLASAWTLFLRVAEEAKREGKTHREEQSRQHADALRPRLPGLTVTLAQGVDAVVTLDGKPVARADLGTRVPVDPGAHRVLVKQGDTVLLDRPFDAKEGQTEAVRIEPVVSRPPAPPPEPPKPPPDPPARGGGLGPVQIAGIAVGAVGLVAAGVGFGFGGVAKSQWDEALTHCGNGDKTQCDASGIALGKDADTSASVATGLVVGGAVVLAAGVVMAIVGPPASRKAARGPGLRLGAAGLQGVW